MAATGGLIKEHRYWPDRCADRSVSLAAAVSAAERVCWNAALDSRLADTRMPRASLSTPPQCRRRSEAHCSSSAAFTGRCER